MKIRSTFFFVCLLGLFITAETNAQTVVTSQPRTSPQGVVMQKIGLTSVKVVFHRPAVKGRQLLGQLIPKGQVWRAGANENTVIYFSEEVKVEGQTLAAGKYGLHMIPSETDWVIIFSKNYNAWGSFQYKQAEDALRVNVKAINNTTFVEHLNFGFDNLENESVSCFLAWGNLKVPFTISTNTHDVVFASLKKELQTQAGWTWRGFHEAANYCLKNKVHQNQALQWATQSVFMQPNAQNMVTKAQLMAHKKGDPEKENEHILASLSNDLASHNADWKTYLGLSQYLVKKNYQLDKAKAWIDQSIVMHSNMTNLMAKADLFENMGKSKEATQFKNNAIAKGTNVELNAYGYKLMWGGKTAEAVKIFEANAEKNPSDPNVWDSLGEGYFNNGQKEKAIESFKKSLSLNPSTAIKANTMKFLKQLGVKETGAQP